MKQGDLLDEGYSALVGSGWYLEFCPDATAAGQLLVFDTQPGPGNHSHRKSHWLINGVTQTVSYISGDPSRRPDKATVRVASTILEKATRIGALSSESWEQLLIDFAYTEGYESFELHGQDAKCSYDAPSKQSAAWAKGFRDSMNYYRSNPPLEF